MSAILAACGGPSDGSRRTDAAMGANASSGDARSDTHADAASVAEAHRGAIANAHVVGYALADDEDAVAPYAPAAATSYNASGGPITVARTSPGNYHVRFFGIGDGNVGVALATAIAAPAGVWCYQVGAASKFVAVRCVSSAGTATDAKFSVTAFARPPMFWLDPPKVTGALEAKQVRATVENHATTLLACHHQHAPDQKTVWVTATLMIGGDGAVTDVKATGRSEAVDRCVAAIFKTLRFARPRDGKSVTVTLRTTFYMQPGVLRAFAPRPSLAFGTPTIEGALDPGIVRRYLKRNWQELEKCYGNELATDWDLRGTSTLTFTISNTGEVTASTVTVSGIERASFASCLADTVKRIVFPKPKTGDVHVAYPLTFRHREP